MAVTDLFLEMPRWHIVAVVSRMARHVQGAVSITCEANRKIVNDAIEVAEASARAARIHATALEFARNAISVADAIQADGLPVATQAARCAAQAAIAAFKVHESQELRTAAGRAFKHAYKSLRRDCQTAFENDIRRVAELGNSMSDYDPAPSEMLDFIRHQAIHEAGHAVAALVIRIPFFNVKIIYEPEVEVVHDPTTLRFADYRLFYAAGAAAEDMSFNLRHEWGLEGDLECHARCKGIHFNADALAVRNLPGFRFDVISQVASELEKRHSLSRVQVEEMLNERGVQMFY